MKVLVVGGGGREHALIWKIKQSPRVSQIYCTPGNGGICAEPGVECIPWDGKDIDALLGIASRIHPDLTVIGPELPLALGVVDELTRRDLRVFGPTKAAAQLEASKGFAKEFMRRHNIPTAHYAVCPNEAELRAALPHFHGKIVVKADGLAAGKGVVIANNREEAAEVAMEMLSGTRLGSAGSSVVLEEFLEGEELSFLVLSDGERIAPLVPAQDHKRVGEGDTGANTGGMGAYSTDSLLDHQMQEWLLTHIVRPVIAGMKAEEAEYRGILYVGLMMTARGPQVLEFNCRFGDPETQAVLMRLESDIVDAFEAAIEGRVSDGDFKWSPDPAVCVVIASGGYPSAFETGKKISGLTEADAVAGVKVFHAGTGRIDGDMVTTGGRVLGVTARGATLDEALQRAYEAVEKISFEGMQYRRDIGAKAVKK
ncbi:MAG: phosphoribosylamine--glycine ligase [Candidatus Angelobacter sp.]|jgi:phosphoribosylamine--glycine ligase|nr:phosphoribosylamine--glycine ligase [Candidatus Angelobacter sp.]